MVLKKIKKISLTFLPVVRPPIWNFFLKKRKSRKKQRKKHVLFYEERLTFGKVMRYCTLIKRKEIAMNSINLYAKEIEKLDKFKQENPRKFRKDRTLAEELLKMRELQTEANPEE